MPAGGWYPEQRLTAEEAVRGYTTWAAYASFTEDVAGVIAPRRRADLTLLSIDPFTENPDSLLSGKVLGTIAAGKFVHGGGGPAASAPR
jgi:predicted amidohydrolase YtcJ